MKLVSFISFFTIPQSSLSHHVQMLFLNIVMENNINNILVRSSQLNMDFTLQLSGGWFTKYQNSNVYRSTLPSQTPKFADNETRWPDNWEKLLWGGCQKLDLTKTLLQTMLARRKSPKQRGASFAEKNVLFGGHSDLRSMPTVSRRPFALYVAENSGATRGGIEADMTKRCVPHRRKWRSHWATPKDLQSLCFVRWSGEPSTFPFFPPWLKTYWPHRLL